jgi:hypothetical protein
VADTGYNWDANWSVIDAAIALTQGGTIQDISAEIDLDGKAACLISFDTDYSNHAKTIFLSAEQFQKFVIQQDWGNTTANAVATTATAIKYATIPVAS